ncbi:MAG: PhoPQ-activated pathogenicity-related family protein [Lentisphaeria bacterium]|nr:PhoPQ-activated pathogenicity-related family protein [Lentisphaeria bacterium]
MTSLAMSGTVAMGAETALDRYVQADDPNYAWREVAVRRDRRGTCHVLHMASQTWRTGVDVNRTLWTHWLEIYVPREVRFKTGLLFVTGGTNGGPPPEASNTRVVRLAVETKSVVAVLHGVPNQPLSFLADPEFRERTEDGILAFSWKRFHETQDPTWLGLLPMVKSAVRAMDTVSAFCGELPDGALPIEKFVVTGASKRGWTSWLTAAVDKRVVGVAPMVIDMLNLRASMKHHQAVYQGFSHALDDYVENGIVEALDAPEAEEALSIVDPYSYRARYTMPKLILNSCGDQFFLPDSWRFYWNDLPASKWMRYIPNTDHGLNDSAYDSIQSFYACVLTGKALPEFTWVIKTADCIRVSTSTTPSKVLVWSAHNLQARDFRQQTIGDAWSSRELAPAAPGEYVATISPPKTGWSAFLVELTFPDPCSPKREIRFTSGVSILPDIKR